MHDINPIFPFNLCGLFKHDIAVHFVIRLMYDTRTRLEFKIRQTGLLCLFIKYKTECMREFSKSNNAKCLNTILMECSGIDLRTLRFQVQHSAHEPSCLVNLNRYNSSQDPTLTRTEPETEPLDKSSVIYISIYPRNHLKS